jgi:hypothetical protein
MDSEFTYQPQYIWKTTANDGLLPVTNFTEEINESELRKRGKDKDKGKELGVITDFDEINGTDGDSSKNRMKHLSNGFYVYLTNRQKYGIIKSKPSDTVLVLKIKDS